MERIGLTPTDELVRRAVIGDSRAFEQLWNNHIDDLRQFVRATIRHIDDFYVEDICSRSFQKAFMQIRTFDGSRSRFPTWLKTIARNTALDTVAQLQRANRNYVSLDDNIVARSKDIDSICDGEISALENIISDEDRDRTRACIEGLPSIYREVARLRLLDGLQYKEIAEELGMELNTVRTRIRRAKAMIEKIRRENAVQ
ncbi:MAG: RNA polymerase sigma factor [Bacteroidales bacterium]|nr:RNA polymerase sigma factor [Bacteroidales bacterium]